MPLWKITDKGPLKVKETKFKEEKLLEEHLEDWIAKDSSILREPLLVFGRQVIIPDTKDRLDLLAVDPNGFITVIELKRGQLKDPVDIQSLDTQVTSPNGTFKISKILPETISASRGRRIQLQ